MGHFSRHTRQERERARKAQASLGDQTNWERAFIYDAFLALLARGVAPTEKNILEESRKLGRREKTRYEAAA